MRSVIALLAACLLALGLSACGRRGALEPPPDPSASSAQKQAEAKEEENIVPSPIGTPRKADPKRGYVIPKDPFILDPLL